MTQPQTEITEFDMDDTTLEPAPSPEEPPSRIKRFLAHAHLPKSLVLTSVLLIVTNIFVTLINQPTIYWIDYESATATSPLLREALAVNPFLFIGGAVIYVILVWLALALLPRFPALVLWMSLCFVHLRDVIWWVDCGVKGIYFNESNNNVCQAMNFSLAIIGAAILGLVLANAWFRARPLTTGDLELASVTAPRLSKKAIAASLVWILFLTFIL